MKAVYDVIMALIEKSPWIAIIAVAFTIRHVAPRDIWLSWNGFKFHIKF